MKVIFAGTPEFAATALKDLHEAGFEIALVLTQPDRPAGRGMQMHASAVKQYALQHGIEVLQPLSLRMDSKDPQRAAEATAAHERLLTTDYDVMVVAAYGLILPRSTLDLKPCINIHGSLLPRWRGAAPIHRAIEAGDDETGVTIMQMEEGLDTGPMLAIERTPIEAGDSTATLHDKLATLGGKMIVETLRKMQQQPLEAVPSRKRASATRQRSPRKKRRSISACRRWNWASKSAPSIRFPAPVARLMAPPSRSGPPRYSKRTARKRRARCWRPTPSTASWWPAAMVPCA